MAKYNFEFKLKIVKEYLLQEGFFKFLSEKYSIPSKSSLKRWVGSYKNLGTKGLIRLRKEKLILLNLKKM